MFAHSIRNPDTIHYFIYQSSGHNPNGGRSRRLAYLCMKASSTTPSKRTRDIARVTCKNCLHEIRKRGADRKRIARRWQDYSVAFRRRSRLVREGSQ